MLPNNAISTYTGASQLLAPHPLRVNQRVDYEEGGAAIEDASQGNMGYMWSCAFDGSAVYVQRNGQPQVQLFLKNGINEIAFAFDQLMRPSVLYQLTSGEMELRWYDSLIAAYTTTNLGPGVQGQMTLDDKRPSQIGNSDIIVAYRRGNSVHYRVQRERYANEYLAASGLSNSMKFRNLAMSKNLRLQFAIA